MRSSQEQYGEGVTKKSFIAEFKRWDQKSSSDQIGSLFDSCKAHTTKVQARKAAGRLELGIPEKSDYENAAEAAGDRMSRQEFDICFEELDSYPKAVLQLADNSFK